ncbi:DNA (cytosine-5-)-methyltransferase [Vallitalea okinawensis]|uniref:DNA (cytosine-5-)-methyltransferase n=1 Tax=Vallitalea okinawensis TaxID=2078660 RepID=UPI000CFC084E|nr:DNA (cytosine-5-)-methyltransferase [Vallitalea okinawensis]
MDRIKLSIANLRKEKGITQTELADSLGVSFQSISKWETGITLPDITLLPTLADYFEVSVDQILGLKPLNNREYILRRTDSKEHWDHRLDYLKNSRPYIWNNDYMEFLIDKVWQISKPINIVDFGCGYGYLGLLLLPKLPKGSTYTGVDVSDKLIEEARTLFKDSCYKTEFIQSDLNLFKTTEKYDMAICQCRLRHLPDPKETLKNMVDAVFAGGMVVTISINRELENAGLYIDGLDYSSFDYKTSALKKLWKTELHSEGRDYSVGMKIPIYMQELGLKNIDVRMNDKINYINPDEDSVYYSEQISSLLKTNSWDKPIPNDEQERIIDLFMNRGLTRAEAESYVKTEMAISNYLLANKENVSILMAQCLLITYGIK